MFEDENPIKLTTFRKLEESIIEKQDVGLEKKEPIKDNREVDEDKKSITEEDIDEEKKSITEKETEEEKNSSEKDTEEEKNPLLKKIPMKRKSSLLLMRIVQPLQ